MRQVIYIDVLLVLNLIINYILLLLTGLLLKLEFKRVRIFFGALLGSLYSLIILLPELNTLFSFIVKMLVCVLIIFVSFGFGTIKRFLRTSLMFLVMTFLFAGVMVGLWILLKPNGFVYNNSSLYFNFNPLVLIITTIACYLIIRLVVMLLNKRNKSLSVCQFKLHVNEFVFSGKAMMDTGNSLRESFTGFPVVICTYSFLKTCFPKEVRPFFSGEIDGAVECENTGWDKKNRLVVYNTIKGKGLLPAFMPDKLILQTLDKSEVTVTKVYIGVINNTAKINEEYDMILSPQILERNEIDVKEKVKNIRQ
ncbi:hypothetical protein SDC9_126307 [bioreactor metagenome]|uniref:Sporulation sigma-E factor-processing peptidase n=1 Tax=bioreactor metagenome TaxID=1076179 RepID=A0A645CQW4_9ZZZZ